MTQEKDLERVGQVADGQPRRRRRRRAVADRLGSFRAAGFDFSVSLDTLFRIFQRKGPVQTGFLQPEQVLVDQLRQVLLPLVDEPGGALNRDRLSRKVEFLPREIAFPLFRQLIKFNEKVGGAVDHDVGPIQYLGQHRFDFGSVGLFVEVVDPGQQKKISLPLFVLQGKLSLSSYWKSDSSEECIKQALPIKLEKASQRL